MLLMCCCYVLSLNIKNTTLGFLLLNCSQKYVVSVKYYFWRFWYIYDFSVTWSSSVVDIFHKGIISLVLCGYGVQMKMFCFNILSESPPLTMIPKLKHCQKLSMHISSLDKLSNAFTVQTTFLPSSCFVFNLLLHTNNRHQHLFTLTSKAIGIVRKI